MFKKLINRYFAGLCVGKRNICLRQRSGYQNTVFYSNGSQQRGVLFAAITEKQRHGTGVAYFHTSGNLPAPLVPHKHNSSTKRKKIQAVTTRENYTIGQQQEQQDLSDSPRHQTLRVMDVDRVDHTVLNNRFLFALVTRVPAERCVQLASLLAVLRDHPNCNRRRERLYSLLLKLTSRDVAIAAELVAFLPRIEMTLPIPAMLNFIRCNGRFSASYVANVVDKFLETRTFDFVRYAHKNQSIKKQEIQVRKPWDLLSYVRMLKPSSAKASLLCVLEPTPEHFNALRAYQTSLHWLPFAAMAGRVDDKLSLASSVLTENKCPLVESRNQKLIREAASAEQQRGHALSHIIPQFGKGLVALPSSSSDAATDYVPAQDTITKTLRAPMRLGDPKSFVLQTIRADSWLSSRSSQELNKPQAFLCPSPWALNYSESSALTYPSAEDTTLPAVNTMKQTADGLCSYLMQNNVIAPTLFEPVYRSLRCSILGRKKRFFQQSGNVYLITRSRGFVRLHRKGRQLLHNHPTAKQRKRPRLTKHEVVREKEKRENLYKRAALSLRASQLIARRDQKMS